MTKTFEESSCNTVLSITWRCRLHNIVAPRTCRHRFHGQLMRSNRLIFHCSDFKRSVKRICFTLTLVCVCARVRYQIFRRWKWPKSFTCSLCKIILLQETINDIQLLETRLRSCFKTFSIVFPIVKTTDILSHRAQYIPFQR